jgi:nitrite reductase (NADH) small subunit
MKPEHKWFRVTYAYNIPLREGRSVMLGDREVAIFNLGERFLAVENRCPHRGGPLAEGIVSAEEVVCPLHGWKINLGAGCVSKPADAGACVARFATRVEGGVVLVQLPVDVAAAEGEAPAGGLLSGSALPAAAAGAE